MLPQLFRLGNFSQPTYGFMAALGLIVALFVVFRLAKQQGLDPDKMWNLGGLAIFSGIIGAKILYLIVDWEYYARNPGQILSLGTLQAGGVFSGGLLLALVVCWWYLRRNNIPFLRAADVFAPAVAIGHAIGRVGCFAAGCCWGRETHVPWAVTFTNPIARDTVGTPLNVPLHPTQMYEMVIELGNFAILYWLIKRKKFEGQVIGLYMMLYGFARYFLEFLRGDPGRGEVFGIITGTQLIAIGLVVAGGVLWMLRYPLQKPVGNVATQRG